VERGGCVATDQMSTQDLLESMPDAVVGVTSDGLIAVVNAHVEEMFGYRRGELIGNPVELLIPDAAADSHPGHRARYFARPVTRPMGIGMELSGRRKDGSEFPVEISLSVLRAEQGLLAIAAIRDVSERRRAASRFRGLLEAAPDATIGVDAAGAIVLVNAQAERLFGYPRTALMGRSIDMLVPDAARNAHPAHRARYAADPLPRSMGAGLRLSARRKDGTEFPVEISLSALDTEDGFVVSAAIRDITERLAAQSERERLLADAEEERARTRQLRSERLESLGQLAGGVAHDFNNLLAVIQNYTGFVAEEVLAAATGDDRWAATSRDVEQIQRAANRAAELTRQLLAFGRRDVTRPQVLDLNEVVADVQRVLLSTIGQHVDLNTALAPGLWPIIADRGQLEQVLVNLTVNARDAMKAGGTLTIRTRNRETVAEPAGPWLPHPEAASGRCVQLQVADTGEGMSQDALARAFEPFFTTKPIGEGTGLGLATVYGIVVRAGGEVQIQTELGVGTTISIDLPATDEPLTQVMPTIPTVSPEAHGETVLLVEDEDALREAVRRMLTRAGYQVFPAHSGPAALDLINAQPGRVDLLLTDVVMPVMLGQELADRVREFQPGIRVMFMSGYAQPMLTSGCALEDDVVLVTKPFSEEELLQHVRAVLDS
jgi:PAS domain S-box-containing protein